MYTKEKYKKLIKNINDNIFKHYGVLSMKINTECKFQKYIEYYYCLYKYDLINIHDLRKSFINTFNKEIFEEHIYRNINLFIFQNILYLDMKRTRKYNNEYNLQDFFKSLFSDNINFYYNICFCSKMFQQEYLTNVTIGNRYHYMSKIVSSFLLENLKIWFNDKHGLDDNKISLFNEIIKLGNQESRFFFISCFTYYIFDIRKNVIEELIKNKQICKIILDNILINFILNDINVLFNNLYIFTLGYKFMNKDCLKTIIEEYTTDDEANTIAEHILPVIACKRKYQTIIAMILLNEYDILYEIITGTQKAFDYKLFIENFYEPFDLVFSRKLPNKEISEKMITLLSTHNKRLYDYILKNDPIKNNIYS